MARWQSCNVLQVGKEGRNVWQFAAASSKFNLLRSASTLPSEPLPAKIVAKDWQAMFQPKLNVAWLPADQVFLRAIQLPQSDLEETRSMIEVQLEKYSPLPVGQIQWSFEGMPHSGDEMQTVVLIIVSRHVIDAFLGKLETQGYLTDRLELPLLDQVRATEINEDGVWIYPGIGLEKDHYLLAWWYGGVLRHISLVYFPLPETRAALMREQVSQTAWAGEIEGWLTDAPRLHVVTDPATTEPWLLELIHAEAAAVVPPMPPQDLAAHTGRRVAKNGQHTNLLPPEYTVRYKQQAVDRVWMRSLGALLVLYLLGLAVYFGWAEIAGWQLEGLRNKQAELSGAYENARRTEKLVERLQRQVDLQYAALECWKAVAENLPVGLRLVSFNFQHGKQLSLRGTGGSGDIEKVQDFNAALREVELQGKPLFSSVETPDYRTIRNELSWNFKCDLPPPPELK